MRIRGLYLQIQCDRRVEAHDKCLRKQKASVDDFNENLEIANRVPARLDEVETCPINASTLQDAKLCTP